MGYRFEREIKRGNIYYLDIPYAIGHEMKKDRPAIVVSCDSGNNVSGCVSVVVCSASDVGDMQGHVAINATPVQSTAMCEHVYTVDKSRLGKCLGRCTNAEMDAVDNALLCVLGLSGVCETKSSAQAEKISLMVARDLYKGMYENLLERLIMG